MNKFNDRLLRLDKSQGLGYSLIRIFLGIALFIRGWILVANPGAIFELSGTENLHMWYSYITIGHLLGGILLAIGFFTRIASSLQIPILVGAVFISDQGLMMGGQSFELATLVLFLLVIFLIFGNGPLSLSRLFNNTKMSIETTSST